MFLRVVHAITEALLPVDGTSGGPERERICHAAGALIEARLAEMPTVMRLGTHVLLVLFEFSPTLVLRRPLSASSIDQRRRHAARGSRWPIVPFGDLVKLVNALSLLVYYSDPAVRERLQANVGGGD